MSILLIRYMQPIAILQLLSNYRIEKWGFSKKEEKSIR